MTFEKEIDSSNMYYLSRNVAVIHKKPTPIQIVKVDYPYRQAATIKEAYFKQPSTTDYNGIYKKRYIDFDVKETDNKTSFPLRNFHAHQIKHLKQCFSVGGVCFVLFKFKKLNQIFLLPFEHLLELWDDHLSEGRKSIPLNFFEKNGIIINYQLNPVIPYLSAVDKLL